MVGVALMDRREYVAGHYAANLIGSGAGGVISLILMHFLSTPLVLAGMAVIGYAAGLLLVSWRNARASGAAAALTIAMVFLLGGLDDEPAMSQYKMLSMVRAMPGTRTLYRTEGPLGRIDVVEGPAIHFAPGLSLQYTTPLPPHTLVMVDGGQSSAVYNCRRREDWRFLDHTTAAAAYRLTDRPRTLVVGAGGGGDIGLARFQEARSVTALEMNAQLIDLMKGPLVERGGRIYSAPRVTIHNREARGYLATASGAYDLIMVPPLDAFGASGAGVYAAQESYLYTVEGIALMLDRLSDRGVLCMTRWARTPPRDGLKLFDAVAQALRRAGYAVRPRMVMIRSWATVTVLASRHEIERTVRLRGFCEDNGFDLCYLPDIRRDEANRYHQLPGPLYYEGAQALLSERRRTFLDRYLFDIEAPTDDRPFFFRFFRWRSLPELRRQLGGQSPAFLELGYLVLVAALAQAIPLSVLLIVAPLVPRMKDIGTAPGKPVALAYFLMLGVGFMALEMAFLQRFILFLAHPIYSAAAVIAGFLVFAGLGSLSVARRGPRPTSIGAAAGAVAGISLVYVLALDTWLAWNQGHGTAWRFAVALISIAPLAFAMGRLFPAGLHRVASRTPQIVPWLWAVNGCASVVAVAGAPLLAMAWGFRWLTVLAAACYALAGILGRRLGEANPPGTRIAGAHAPKCRTADPA
jgi:hypothetical protein